MANKSKLKNGSMNNNIEGVIFDFNGTLFFDSEIHKKAWNKISMEIRSNSITEEEFLKYIFGHTNRAIMQYLFQKDVSDNLISEIAYRKEVYYRGICLQDPTNLKLVSGARRLFNILQKHKISKTIATASEIENVKFFNEQFGLDRWFDFEEIVYDDNIIKGKPAPDMFLKAANNIGAIASKCIVFEDSETGVVAAKSAGVGKIIVLDPEANQSKFYTHTDVDLIIPDFTEFNINQYL